MQRRDAFSRRCATKYTNLLSTNDIIQILTKNLGFQLKAVGKSIFFLCPFHDDHNPSFCFSPTYKLFRCFSCNNFNQGRSGNIFNLLAQYKNIEFIDAVKEIGGMGFFSYDIIEKDEKKKKKNDNFFVNLVTNIYHYNLLTKEGNPVFRYLTIKRKISLETIKNFLLGCTTQKKQLANLILNEEKFSSFVRNNSDLWYISTITEEIKDFFPVSSVVFPLKDESGEITSWAIRNLIFLNEKNKYCFLPGFEKSNFLYNFFEIKHSKEEECFLVEGFFDVISLFQKGITNCVGLLGTGMSSKQLCLLKNLKKRIVLFLDNDKAGREASVKILISLLIEKIDCEIVSTDFYFDDPDNLCSQTKTDDPKTFKEILNKRVNPYSFIIKYLYEENQIKENPQRIKSFIHNVIKTFYNCPVSHFFLIKQLQQLIPIEKEKENMISLSSNDKTLALPPKVLLKNFFEVKLKILEKNLINLCFKSKDCFLLIFNINFSFENEDTKKIFQVLVYNYYNGCLSYNLKSKVLISRAIYLNIATSLLKQIEKIKIFPNLYEKNK